MAQLGFNFFFILYFIYHASGYDSIFAKISKKLRFLQQYEYML